jgi:hypothetical protein
MTTVDFIIELFCRVDDQMPRMKKHSQAHLYPSELVTIGLLFALKGCGTRAFYRWLSRDYRSLFPHLPERTRLFRLLGTHADLTDYFLADATTLGVIDAYGLEFIHPVREGRSEAQIGRKGLSNKRWIVGGKLCLILNQRGLVVDWQVATANVHDTRFHPLIARWADEMVLLSDSGFHAAQGDPANLLVCARGTWNERMVIETVLSMLTTVCHFKKVSHRLWQYVHARLAFTLAMFNLLVQWYGLTPDESGRFHLSIAEFSL